MEELQKTQGSFDANEDTPKEVDKTITFKDESLKQVYRHNKELNDAIKQSFLVALSHDTPWMFNSGLDGVPMFFRSLYADELPLLNNLVKNKEPFKAAIELLELRISLQLVSAFGRGLPYISFEDKDFEKKLYERKKQIYGKLTFSGKEALTKAYAKFCEIENYLNDELLNPEGFGKPVNGFSS